MRLLVVVLVIAGCDGAVLGPLAVTRISDLEVTTQIQMSSGSGPKILAGAGDPNGATTAPQGSLILQTDTAALWQNTTGTNVWAAVGGGAGGSAIGLFGDGSDGAATFDGTSTVLGLVPSAGVYTLARDIMCNGCTIDAAATIRGGYRIFDIDTLTLNGTIERNGTNGLNQTGGAALSGGTLPVGVNGGTGGNSAGGTANSGGTISIAIIQCTSGAAPAGTSGAPCQGGGGGTGDSGAGATGGNVTLAGGGIPGGGYEGDIRSIWQAPGGDRAAASTGDFSFASGGGGGRGDAAAAAAGGGGGASGGYIYLAAHTITGTGQVSARGGNGGNGNAAGDTGGGGGGGGGTIFVMTVGACPTRIVSGGTGGLGQGTGTNGGDGGNGFTYCFQL